VHPGRTTAGTGIIVELKKNNFTLIITEKKYTGGCLKFGTDHTNANGITTSNFMIAVLRPTK
jgi:hypothetical protein